MKGRSALSRQLEHILGRGAPRQPQGAVHLVPRLDVEKSSSNRGFAVLLIAALAAELSLAHRVGLWGASPDAVLVLVVLGSLGLPPGKSAPRAFCAGLLTDVLFGRRLGAFALSYALCAEGLAAARPYFFEDHPATQLASLAACALGVEMLSFGLNSLAEGALVPGGFLLSIKIAISTWLVGACVVGVLRLVRIVRR